MFANGFLLSAHDIDWFDRQYLDGSNIAGSDPRVSPLGAPDLSGLPPALVITAGFDPLRDEGRDYFERLALAHSEVSYTCHPGMIHLFYGLGAVIPYARTAFEQIGGEIRAALA